MFSLKCWFFDFPPVFKRSSRYEDGGVQQFDNGTYIKCLLLLLFDIFNILASDTIFCTKKKKYICSCGNFEMIVSHFLWDFSLHEIILGKCVPSPKKNVNINPILNN